MGTTAEEITTAEEMGTTVKEETTTAEVETTTHEEEATTAEHKTTTMEHETTTVAIECVDDFGYMSFIPHPTDCTKYYVCNGFSTTPVLMTCAPPLYFDPSINVCNYPEQVQCLNTA